MKSNSASILFLALFLTFSIASFSQTKEIDSLKTELENYKIKDSTRANLLFDLGHEYHKTEPDKAMIYFDESEKLSDSLNYILGVANNQYFKGITIAIKTNSRAGANYIKESIKNYGRIKNKRGIARSNEALGIFSFYNNDFKKSIEYRLKATDIKTEIGDKKGVLNGLFYLAITYNKIGEYTKALSYYDKAIKLSEELNDYVTKADCFSDIGNIYGNKQNLPLALEYHNKSMDIGEKIKDDKVICDALISIGSVHNMNGNYDTAIEFYNKALAISKKRDYNRNTTSILNNLGTIYFERNDFIQALNFFEKSLNRSREEGNEFNVALSCSNIGWVFVEQKKHKLALQYLKESEQINLKIGTKRGLASCYLGISQVFLNQKKYPEALTYAIKGNKLAEELDEKSDQKLAFSILTEIYKATGNYKMALESHEQFKILNDSIFNKENIQKITQLEYDYKYKQALDSASIRELKLTKTVLTTSQDLEKSKRNLFLGVIGFLITALILGGIIFFLKLRNEKSKTQNAVIEQKLLRSQMTPHFIFNSLSVLQGMILNKEDKKSVYYLSKFSKLLRLTLENSRDKLVPLNQELEAVNSYLELQNLEASESYNYTILIDENIDETRFQIPPMLIQPFIENAIEHAFKNRKENRKIDIQVEYINDELICTIMDNGIGIDAPNGHKRKDKKSLATAITSERLKTLSKDLNTKGSITIEDRKQYNEQGTIVTLVIPYKKELA